MQSQNKKSNFRTTMGYLTINGKQYPVYEGINTIGRCITATVPLKALNVSKQHAILTVVGHDEHYLSDFQSFNGTSLNKTKLSPLLLYKITQNSVIEFGDVTATYNTKVSNDSAIDAFRYTQTATQSLYEAHTQAVEEDVYQNSTENKNQPQNYFDDDFSFDEISTQMIDESREVDNTVFKVPLSIHDLPTQTFCVGNSANIHNVETQKLDDSAVAEDPTDIHNLETQKLKMIEEDIHNVETQKLDITPFEINTNSSINDMPTQILTDENKQDDISSFNDIPTQILDSDQKEDDFGGVLDSSKLEAEKTVPDKSASQNLESQSKSHVSELQHINTEDDFLDNSEIVCNSPNNESGFDTSSIVNETVLDSSQPEEAQVTIITKVASQNSESQSKLHVSQLKRRSIKPITDSEDDHLNASDASISEDRITFKSKKRVGIIESDTETDVEDLDENCTKNDSGSDTDIEGLEKSNNPVQELNNPVQELNPVNNTFACTDSDSDTDEFQFNIQTGNDSECNDEIIPGTQLVEEEVLENNNMKETEHNKMANSVDDMDSLYLEPTQPIVPEGLVIQSTQGNTENEIFLQPIQPLVEHENQSSTTQDDAVFIKPTRPVKKGNKSMGQLHDESQSQDELFLLPTQPITGLSNMLSSEDSIFAQATQPVASTLKSSLNENIFMEPTQPVNLGESQDELFLQPTQPITNNFQAETNDDIFMQPTQALDCDADKDIFLTPAQSLTAVNANKVTNKDVENNLEKLFASQNMVNAEPESQLEVTFETQNVSYVANVSYRPLNPLVNELEGLRNEDSQISEDPMLSKESNPGRRNKQRKSSLSLQKQKVDDLEDDNELVERLEPIIEEKIKESVENANSTKKTKKASVKKTNKKDIDLENLVETNIEIEEEISQPMRTTRSRANSKTSKVKAVTSKSTKKNTKDDESNEKNSKNGNITSNSDTTDVSLLEDDSRTTKTNATEKKKENKGRTRSAKNDEISNDENEEASVKKRLIRSAKTVTNIPEANGENQSEDGKKTKKSTKEKGTNKRQVRKNEARVSVGVQKDPKEKMDDPDKNVEIIEIPDTPVKSRTTKSKKNKPKSTKPIEIDTTPKNETEVSNDNVVENCDDTSKSTANKRKSTEDVNITDLSVDSNESEVASSKRLRRVNFKEAETPSSTSVPSRTTRKKRNLDTDLETPKKSAKISNEETPNTDTPNRNRRLSKPKVVFTMLDSPELESVIRSLGGLVVDSVESCTVLVTGNLKRTQKLLSAVGLSKPICSPKWLQECKKASKFLDPWDYILEDKDAESNWKLSLKQSLIKSQTQKIFQNYIVYITVTNSVDVLKAAVESCGGKCVTKAPGKVPDQNLLVVANSENKSKYTKFLKQDPPVQVVLPEAIFDGVLRQELRFKDYSISQ